MTQVYSVPGRENDPYALPDVEVFYQSADEFRDAGMDTWQAEYRRETDPVELAGWYYWYCLPGCLPDGDPIGPFDSEQAAIDDAQEDSWQFEDDDDDAEADNA